MDSREIVVYSLVNNSWVSRGQDIEGLDNFYGFGVSNRSSYDGSIIVAGASLTTFDFPCLEQLNQIQVMFKTFQYLNPTSCSPL